MDKTEKIGSILPNLSVTSGLRLLFLGSSRVGFLNSYFIFMVVNNFITSINAACLKTRLDGMASGRSWNLVTRNLKKIKTTSFLRGPNFLFFIKKKRQKMLRALVCSIICIGFIHKNNFAINHNGQLPISPVGVEHCNNMSSRRFDTPSRSIYIIFQEEYKGPKNEILISGAPKSI